VVLYNNKKNVIDEKREIFKIKIKKNQAYILVHINKKNKKNVSK
jgi:hypothetical protein